MKNSRTHFTRRQLLRGGIALGAVFGLPKFSEGAESDYKISNGRINQSVAWWCFKPMSVEDLALNAAKIGLKSVELLTPENFSTVKKHGLICAMVSSHGFAKGFAQRDQHEECLQNLRERIDATAAAGFPNVITFSGYRKGLSDEVATKNMIDGLKQIVGYAEKKKVTLCLEMLNSKVHIEMKGHPDYFCDDMERSIDICRQIGSQRMKVLFDIYHVQIMHGDIISRIKQHHPFVAHYHTAGNPGRNEIDDTQEINYAGVMKAILETGYKGVVAQEFVPLRDKVTSLSQAVKICDV